MAAGAVAAYGYPVWPCTGIFQGAAGGQKGLIACFRTTTGTTQT